MRWQARIVGVACIVGDELIAGMELFVMESPLASIVQVFEFILILPFLVMFVVLCEIGKLLWRVIEILAGEKTVAEAWKKTEPVYHVTIYQRGHRVKNLGDGSPENQPVREINLGDFPSRWPLQAKRALALLPFRVNPFAVGSEDIYEQLMSIPTGWERLTKPTTRRVRAGDHVIVTFKADNLEVCIYCLVSEIERCTNLAGSIFSGHLELIPITSDFNGPFGWIKKLWRLTFQCVGFSWLWQPRGYVLPENWPAAIGENSWLCWYERDQPIVWGWRRDC